jgi:hypothetical protein
MLQIPFEPLEPAGQLVQLMLSLVEAMTFIGVVHNIDSATLRLE